MRIGRREKKLELNIKVWKINQIIPQISRFFYCYFFIDIEKVKSSIVILKIKDDVTSCISLLKILILSLNLEIVFF